MTLFDMALKRHGVAVEVWWYGEAAARRVVRALCGPVGSKTAADERDERGRLPAAKRVLWLPAGEDELPGADEGFLVVRTRSAPMSAGDAAEQGEARDGVRLLVERADSPCVDYARRVVCREA